MPESKSHTTTANRIAKKLGGEYNPAEGPDIVTPRAAVEVETVDTVKDALKQLRGFKKDVFIAGTNQDAVQKALEATKGTTVGVMDNQGNVVKPSTRKKR